MPAETDTESNVRGQHPRHLAMFMVITLALFMSSMLGTAIATALHTLQVDFDTTITWAGWTITGYSLGLVVMLPIAGRLADYYGRRRVLLVSVVIFTLASLACGFAPNIYTLIVLRAIQAAGGAGFTPAATGLVVQHFGAARDRYLGMFSSIFPIGAMAGPVIGGAFVEWGNWRWIFFAVVPVGAVMIPLVLRLVPVDPPRSAARRSASDSPGIALLATALLVTMLTLTYAADHTITIGSKPWLVTGGLAAAAVLFALFITHIRRAPDPIISPRLIFGRGFGSVNVINIVYSGAVIGLISLVPLYATTRFGMSAFGSGMLLLAESIATILVTSIAVFLLRRTGYRLPIVFGGAAVSGSMTILWLTPVGMYGFVYLIAALVLSGAGLGMLSPASRNAGIQLAPDLASSIAAVRTVGFQVGTIGAVSIVTMAMAAAADPVATQALAYGIFAMVVLVVMPIVARVPEHKGAW